MPNLITKNLEIGGIISLTHPLPLTHVSTAQAAKPKIKNANSKPALPGRMDVVTQRQPVLVSIGHI